MTHGSEAPASARASPTARSIREYCLPLEPETGLHRQRRRAYRAIVTRAPNLKGGQEVVQGRVEGGGGVEGEVMIGVGDCDESGVRDRGAQALRHPDRENG